MVSMDNDGRELKWVGSSLGIWFTADDDSGLAYDDRSVAIPAWATDVRAVLPSGEARVPTVEGNGLVFRPPLPKRSRVLFQGRLLFTVED